MGFFILIRVPGYELEALQKTAGDCMVHLNIVE
jgi:hypothetical protein